MPEPDFTDKVVRWLYDSYEVSPKTAMTMVAGIQIAAALAARHPTYTQAAHWELGADYRRRIAGDELLFQAMAVASGDERTSPEHIADEMVEACPLPT